MSAELNRASERAERSVVQRWTPPQTGHRPPLARTVQMCKRSPSQHKSANQLALAAIQLAS